MKTVRKVVQMRSAKSIRPLSHGAALLALGLIISVLLAACGGAPPANESANAQAASEGNAAVQEDTAGQASETNAEAAPAEKSLPGSEEFGLTEEQLVEYIEAVEARIADCMSEAGFEYIPVDYLTVRKAMISDKSLPGLGDEEYAAAFGFGISTQLETADAPPQLAGANTVIQIGLGEQNVEIFKNLSEADQEAYNHTLFGENTDATFAYTLEAEDFSETGGCTRTAIEQVFSPDELDASYYNPGDALIEQDPRVIEAIAAWSDCMREAGFDYNNPEETEPDFEDRLEGVLDGADPESLSPDAQAALTELQGEERAVAVAQLQCEEEYVEPVVQQVETELYGGPQR